MYPAPSLAASAFPTNRAPFASPFFSITCKLPLPQLSSFLKHTNCPQGWECPLTTSRPFRALSSLLQRSLPVNSPTINSFRTLLQNNRGGGGVQSVTSHHRLRLAVLAETPYRLPAHGPSCTRPRPLLRFAPSPSSRPPKAFSSCSWVSACSVSSTRISTTSPSRSFDFCTPVPADAFPIFSSLLRATPATKACGPSLLPLWSTRWSASPKLTACGMPASGPNGSRCYPAQCICRGKFCRSFATRIRYKWIVLIANLAIVLYMLVLRMQAAAHRKAAASNSG